MKQEIENFHFVEASLQRSFKSLSEISFINRARTPNEIELVNGPPFDFYRVSLHYMFTMEYIKLMELNKEQYPTNHYASLEKLSITVFKNHGDNFKQKHELNLDLLSEIRASDFFNKLKGDRDKKFAHADSNYSDPFSFHSFSDGEIQEGSEHLKKFKLIMDNCTSVFDYEFAFQHIDSRTDNFIKFHTKYKEYYYKNYFDAMKNGCGLL
ncbi:hypothetical protein DIU31_014460 [Mucilaginibacter rubeus]|uniref:HEPN AbiU2-like domain-containing protein n=1 Tax=Mucilaginibacter rubeus TaxID=2027860 RepID=A0AAE6MIH7_9SPHI|nr:MULTISPECIES: hypothetical protein [Mucilaginibacter]QEM04656.1 hypothetical protein DIU31_014460 [Mucilaginibacter rubeus]QEM17250.1 hypothetical protein DIU38_014610 [Mucilaginibacter gossypii]QTE46241.1 hypothetical protein J3L19_13085 [Mucilaginibacter rubeus]QTE52838.1 hypothetical protein J3L21_13060 [Mucilaginibacter rubeus]QTE57925.1 hypothetical protein J3L23_04735 [Mucilaginibacter rubeus]